MTNVRGALGLQLSYLQNLRSYDYYFFFNYKTKSIGQLNVISTEIYYSHCKIDKQKSKITIEF